MSKYIVTTALVVMIGTTSVQAADIHMDIKEVNWELKPGLSTQVWSYNGSVPGTPIVVQEGEQVVVEGIIACWLPLRKGHGRDMGTGCSVPVEYNVVKKS